MSNDSDNSTYVDYNKSIAFSGTSVSRCDKCKTLVSCHSMAEHIKLKHTLPQSESDQNDENTEYTLKSRYQKIDALLRKPFRNLTLNKNNTNTYNPKTEHNGSIEKENFVYKSDNCLMDKSSDDTDCDDVKESKVKRSHKRLDIPGYLEQNDAADAMHRISREAKSSIRLVDAMAKKKTSSDIIASKKSSGDIKVSKKTSSDIMVSKKTSSGAIDAVVSKKSHHRSSSQMRPYHNMPALIKAPRREMSVVSSREKIPSIYEMFNIRPKNSDMRGSKVENENDYEQSSRPDEKLSPSKQFIPMNSIQCPLCLNVMHKNYFKGHLMRTHYNEDATLAVDNDDYSKCDICGNLMPEEHIQAHVERTHGSLDEAHKNRDNFVRCNFCPAFMHIDYMAGHLFRKHQSHAGSIGIIWPQYTEEQFWQWLNEGLIYIKNGAIFVGQVVYEE